jgi:hypothetical protein
VDISSPGGIQLPIASLVVEHHSHNKQCWSVIPQPRKPGSRCDQNLAAAHPASVFLLPDSAAARHHAVP